MSSEPSRPDDGAPPTGARHWVVVFAAALAVITYIDRTCLGVAKFSMAADLHLSPVQMGYVFSSFFWAYALFEIPGGWLGDLIGPRRVLIRVVLLWSFFTAATGRVWNQASLVVTQFLFGAGEAGGFPNLAKAFTSWLPARERSRAVSVMWLATRWGAAVTPILAVWVVGAVGWRWAFAIFAIPGFVWAAAFFLWYRDRPRDHPGVNAAELALIEERRPAAPARTPVPWARILRSRSAWLLFLQYFCFGYGWYFYINWLPTYLHEARGLELHKGALLSGLPLFVGGFACLLSGWLVDWLADRGFDLARVRRTLACGGFWGAAVMLLLSPRIADPVWATVAMALASFSLDLSLPVTWRTAMDIGGAHAGSVSGTMNMCAQVGGAIGPIVVGYILQYLNHNWTLTFVISAVLYGVGGLCWLWIDPVTPVESPS
ncbi:MAG TPA: MFS transporter [Opitutaceae bacterium]|jgi:MFS family permease|nr:MFS transporter [Opitutaceae bacterium]